MPIIYPPVVKRRYRDNWSYDDKQLKGLKCFSEQLAYLLYDYNGCFTKHVMGKAAAIPVGRWKHR